MIMNSSIKTGIRGRRRTKHLGYALFISLLMVMTAYVAVLPVFGSHLQNYLGIGDATFGLIFSLGALAGIGLALIGGPLVDRLGAVRMIRYGLRGVAAGMILLALPGAHWQVIMAGCTVCSIASGSLVIAVYRYLVQLFPRDRRRVLALTLAICSGGGILLPLIAEGLLLLSRNVQGLSFATVLHGPFAVIAVVVLAASTSFRGGKRRAIGESKNTKPLVNWHSLILPLPIAWLVFMLGLHGAADTTLMVWMPRFLGSATLTDHPLVPGVVISAYSLSYLVARSLLALLPEDWGRRRLLVLPGLLGGGVLIAGILFHNFWLAAGGYVLGAFLWSSEYPAIQGVIAERDRRHFGAALALVGVPGGILGFALIHGTGLLAAAVGERNLDLAILLPALCFPLVGLAGALWVGLFYRARLIKSSPGPAGRMSVLRGDRL